MNTTSTRSTRKPSARPVDPRGYLARTIGNVRRERLAVLDVPVDKFRRRFGHTEMPKEIDL